MTSHGRRSKNDPFWSDLKNKVKSRDRSCRLMKVLTAKEALLLIKGGGPLSVLDPAHVFGSGPFPHMVYDTDNVVLLNRVAHDRLDTFKDPITGKPITKEEHTVWWKRIVGEKIYESLEIKSKNQGDNDAFRTN